MLDETFKALTGRYITPPTTPATSPRWRINIPDHPQFVAALKELIVQLANPEVWIERSTGGLTLDETAALAMKMYSTFRKDDTMLGVVVPIATANIPATMLLCDGAAYNAADYPDLFAVINPALQLSGSTFKTPDLRGRFILASGNGDYPDYSIGGEYHHPLTQAELPFHQHTTNPHTHVYTLTTVSPSAAGEILGAATFDSSLPAITGDSGYLTDNGAGGDQPHENMPPYYVLRYAIIAKVG